MLGWEEETIGLLGNIEFEGYMKSRKVLPQSKSIVRPVEKVYGGRFREMGFIFGRRNHATNHGASPLQGSTSFDIKDTM